MSIYTFTEDHRLWQRGNTFLLELGILFLKAIFRCYVLALTVFPLQTYSSPVLEVCGGLEAGQAVAAVGFPHIHH